MFQLAAARRRLMVRRFTISFYCPFQLAAARRRLMPPLKPLTGKAYITLFR